MIGDSEFDTATAVRETGPGRYAALVDPAWSIGGRPNGGYLLALAARACLEMAAADPADHPDPLAVSASFPSSPAPGPVEIEVEMVRRGRAFSVLRARLTQDGEPQLDAVTTCGRLPDAAETLFDGTTRPVLPPPERCFQLPTEGPGFEVLLMGVVREQLDPAVLGWTRGSRAASRRFAGTSR